MQARVERVAKAESQEREGLWELAARTWSEVVADHPNGSSHLRYGRTLRHAGRLSEATEVFRRAIDLAPDDVDAHFYLGIVLEEQGQLAEARQYLEEGLRRQTRQEILNILGSVQRRSRDLAAAETTYRHSLEMNQQDDEAHLGLGLVLKESDPVQAAVHLRECLRLSPAFPGVRRELGHALWRAGDRSQAEATLREAIAEDPADSWAHDYLGHLLGLKGQWEEAAERFMAAAQAEPEISFFWCNLAEATASLGSHEEAERLFIRALSMDPNDPHTNLKYGLFLKRIRKLEKAASHLRKVLEEDPDGKRARRALAEISAWEGRRGDLDPD